MGEITPSNKERTTNTTDLHYLTSLFTDSQALSSIWALTSSAYIYYTCIIHGVQYHWLVMFKTAKNQRPKQRFAVNAYASYLGKASKTLFVQLQTNKFQGYFKDFSGTNYSFSRRLVKFNIFSRLYEPWKNTNRRVEKLIYTKDNLLVTVGNDRTTPILINLCHLLVACTRFLSV